MLNALLILIALATIAGVGFFAIRKARADQWLTRMTRLRRSMKDELEHDAIDDKMAHDLSTRARDKGAV